MRWERGVTPDPAAQTALSQLFDVSSETIARVAWPNWLPAGGLPGVDHPWDYPGTIKALTEVAEKAVVDRRQFLALTGAELLLPIYAWRLNPGPWLAYRDNGHQVSAALVDEVERLLALRRRMDDEHGGGSLLDMLHSDLRFVTHMLRNGSYSEDIGTRLHAAAAELARLAGWAAFDGGRHAAAQQYYLAGLRAATAVGDHALAVNIVGFLGIQAYSTGRTGDAVQLMDVATSESRQKTPPIIQAMTWARGGRAYAKIGDAATARGALSKSSTLLDRARDGDTPTWAYWVDGTRLSAQLGRALFDLGDYPRAERELTAAVQACGSSYPRDRATWLGRIAIAQIRIGNIDEGCGSGRRTVDLLADQVDSQRARAFIATFRQELSFFGTPVAHDFLEYANARLGPASEAGEPS
jgi:tetratricopeptide (TPR) repeat protein